MPTKVQIFFNWGRKGWSEVWYSPLSNTSASLPGIVLAYTQARTQVMYGGGVDASEPLIVPEFYRLSDIQAPNKSRPASFEDAPDWTYAPLSTPDRRNWPYCSLLIDSGGHRTVKFKGTGQAWISKENPNYRYASFTGPLKVAFDRWLTAVKTAGWAPLLATVPSEFNITALSIDGNGNLNVTPAGGSYLPNQKVRIKGIRGSGTRGLNGVWRIKEVLTGGVLVLCSRKRDCCTFDPCNKGQIGVVVYTLGAFVFPDPVSGVPYPITGFTSGKLGNASKLDTGKAPAAPRCCLPPAAP